MELADAKESLDAYARDGRPLGDFLTAILSNDLFDAFGRADASSHFIVFDICQYIYNELPSNIWGSREKVKAWIDKKMEEREEQRVRHDKPQT